MLLYIVSRVVDARVRLREKKAAHPLQSTESISGKDAFYLSRFTTFAVDNTTSMEILTDKSEARSILHVTRGFSVDYIKLRNFT